MSRRIVLSLVAVLATSPTGGWTRYVWGLSYDLTKTVVKMKCVSAGQTEACSGYTGIPYDVRIETRPDGSWIRRTFVPLRGQEAKTEWRSPSGVLMRTVDRDWTFQREVPLLTRETTTLNETNLKSKVEYDHDTAGYVWGVSTGATETWSRRASATGGAVGGLVGRGLSSVLGRATARLGGEVGGVDRRHSRRRQGGERTQGRRVPSGRQPPLTGTASGGPRLHHHWRRW